MTKVSWGIGVNRRRGDRFWVESRTYPNCRGGKGGMAQTETSSSWKIRELCFARSGRDGVIIKLGNRGVSHLEHGPLNEKGEI